MGLPDRDSCQEGICCQVLRELRLQRVSVVSDFRMGTVSVDSTSPPIELGHNTMPGAHNKALLSEGLAT